MLMTNDLFETATARRARDRTAPTIESANFNQSIAFTEGHPFELSVITDGRPAPEVCWIKDGKRLEESLGQRVQILDDGRSHRVVASQADETHEGNWTVIASNPSGLVTMSTRAEVLSARDFPADRRPNR
ncbi:hypothetical protein Ciccas_004549 [Cichlidogyrus casuarinus]|uniref:Ig-like domain-containing protein n=1 Tax=Cichlidogyrus casuarinus TaxID=1844966 RepID=A0ABD2QB61_9PLAT